MFRIGTFRMVVGIFAGTFGGWAAAPVSGQVVEPDAPERIYAGCYSVTPDVPFHDVGPLDGREERYQLPDTINLNLQLRTLGWSLAGPRDWREQGYFLGVDPTGVVSNSIHRLHRWHLSGTHLVVVQRSCLADRSRTGLRSALPDRSHRPDAPVEGN